MYLILKVQITKVLSINGNSLAVQWLRLCTFTAGGTCSIPGQGTKILHTTWHGQIPQGLINTDEAAIGSQEVCTSHLSPSDFEIKDFEDSKSSNHRHLFAIVYSPDLP